MSIYKYPRTQDVKFGAFFIMSNVFDSKKYDKYIIKESQTDKKYIFSHEKIKHHLENNPGDRDSRVGFANGNEFIRIRLELAEKI